MKRFRGRPDPGKRGSSGGEHLSDEVLIALLDGELKSPKAEEAEAHVLSCWACRSRRQAIEAAIGDLVAYENAVAAPYLPPSAEGRAAFLARLSALAAATDHPPALQRFLRWTTQLPETAFASRAIQIAVALTITVGCLVAWVVRSPRVVSADEVLDRAIASEAAALPAVPVPIVVQKLRISVGPRSITRTIYRDMAHRRTVSQTDAATTEREAAQAAYLRSSLDWDTPLDAAAYRRWCRRQRRSHATVVRNASNRITLQTRISAGSVTEADLTLRAGDYHAIAENFRFEDHSVLEIAELSWEVIPLAALPKGVFGLPLPPPPPHLPSIVRVRPMLPTSAELAQSEVDAESVLHRLGGDLGEQINIAVTPAHSVLIEGVVADNRRKGELETAFRGVAHTTLRLTTVDEMARYPSGTRAATHPPSSVQVMQAAPPLLDAELEARFPDKDQRIAYVNQTLSMVQIASARAWALNRLADRHPAATVALLDDGARREFRGLLLDHVSVLREDLSSLRNQLAQVLSRSSNTPAANTPVPVPHGTGDAQAEDWRERIRRVHSSTETIHEAVATLLTTSPPGRGNDTEAIEVNLRTSITQVEAELQVLDEQLQREILK